MSNVPGDLRYTKDHEWAKLDGDVVTVGITDHAQAQLGDVVFLELPEPGRALKAHDAFGVVESVKAVSDLYSPLAGTVVEANAALVDKPETVNTDPYGAAWMVKLKLANAGDFASLLDAAAYQKFLSESA